jgi:hypothetical protein
VNQLTLSDQDLVVAMKNGDQKAFEALYEQYWPEVSTMIYRRLNGEYILDNVSLKSFAQTFGNAFSMEVRFRQKALEGLPVSMQFYRTDHPKTILNQLKLIHGLHYQIKDKEVILMR